MTDTLRNKEAEIGSDRMTLKEIARLAGVSISTASVVLADKAEERRISQDAVRRVREVARQHNYAPNLLVRSLRKGRTQVISFYNAYGNREKQDLYMESLLTAVERATGAHGYELLLHCDHSRPVDVTYKLLNGGRSDGLLFFGPQYNNALLPLLRRSRLPTVILNRADEGGVLSSVTDDMDQGIQLAADALLQLGHRRIGSISGRPDPWTPSPMRIDAMRRYLAGRGIELVDIAVYPKGPISLEGAIRQLLSLPEPVTALFCWHDRMGYSALEACEALGIAVPERLSVIGYDGIHWPSTSRHILTSVEVPLDTIAVSAVQLLHELILGQAEAPVCRVLPVSLWQGTTLAPPFPGDVGSV